MIKGRLNSGLELGYTKWQRLAHAMEVASGELMQSCVGN